MAEPSLRTMSRLVFFLCTPAKVCAIAIVALLLIQSVHADVILNSITGSVTAQLGATTSSGSTTLQIGSVTRTVGVVPTDYTKSDESQNWNDLTKSLTGSGLITESRTTTGTPSTHNGLSTLTINFTTTTNTSLSLGGTWGFVNDTGQLADSIGWTLTGPSTSLSQNATAGGGSSQAFSQTALLNVGTYTFTISANFNERFNSSTRTANWNLTSFNLVSVPENNPLTFIGLSCSLLFVTIRIRRKRLCRQAAHFSSSR